jgi:hypothetical protein
MLVGVNLNLDLVVALQIIDRDPDHQCVVERATEPTVPVTHREYQGTYDAEHDVDPHPD